MNGGRSEERPASLAVRMDKGPRGTQQDHIAACKVYSGGSREITLVVQLDGMGGYAGGDVAAQIAGGHCLGKAVLALSGVGSPPVESTEWETFCADCVKAANEAVVREKAVNQGLSEAGSTIVFAAVVNRNVHLAWLGDSRAYIYRGGTMEKLTHDHSRTQELIDRRELSPDDREDHP
ncbi:MAG: hypothetical protein HON70_34270, partial [Lentisphaerae bacterium]|nr:hypothetical protein [Lentisphaerota bacterium]